MPDKAPKRATSPARSPGFSGWGGAKASAKEKETEAAHGASRRNFAALHMAKQQEQRKPYEVAFRCTFKKSFARKCKRFMKLDLYNKTLELTFPDGSKKLHQTEHITEIRKGDLGVVELVIEDRKNHRRSKQLVFDYEEESARFVRAVNTLNEHGDSLQSTFNELDSSCEGFVKRSDVEVTVMDYMRQKYAKSPQVVEEQAAGLEPLVTNMMQIVSTGSSEQNGIAYADFFMFFSIKPPADSTACIADWIVRTRDREESYSGRPSTASANGIGGYSPRGDRARSTNSTGFSSEPEGYGFDILPGEIVSLIEEQVRCAYICRAQDVAEHGTLYITNYRLVFAAYMNDGIQSGVRTLEQAHVPLATIFQVKLSATDASMDIICKDLRPFKITFFKTTNEEYVGQVSNIISQMATVPAQNLFAFSYLPMLAADNGWGLYNPVAEYTRMGCFDSDGSNDQSVVWRIFRQETSGTLSYSFSPTYAATLVLPALMTDLELAEAASYRSKKRLPAVTYREKISGAVLCRSSQPMAGVGNKRSKADERLLDLYRTKGNPDSVEEATQPSHFHIIDCRGAMAATGNQVQGKGVENPSNYKFTDLTYCNIGNIHTMRDSLEKLAEIVLPGSDDESFTSFLSALDETKWLQHLILILAGSVNCMRHLLNGESVLIHCSDGWDRTAQISATSQLLIDPYYRTLQGFAVLIEKDWCGFGHKFQDRCGHGSTDHKDERSPVFVQWLDTVQQIMIQFPTAFEFSEKLLVFLADHIFSCLFGNFLGNWEKQRADLNVQEKTTSIWAYVMKSSSLFKNSAYQPLQQPIEPTASLKKVRLWERYYCRWDSAMHPHELAGIDWTDDWGTVDQLETFQKKMMKRASHGAATQRMVREAAQAELDMDSPSSGVDESSFRVLAASASAHSVSGGGSGITEAAERELAVTDERESFMEEYRNSDASTGSFTNTQLEEFTGAFELFDADKDGIVSAEEMAQVLDSIGHNHTKEELLGMMKKAGTVGDDGEKIDFEGFVRMMTLWVQELDPS